MFISSYFFYQVRQFNVSELKMSTSCPNLGKVVLNSSSASSAECLNPEVWVKRKDKTQGQVKLMEEHAKHLKEQYPKLSEEFRSFPSEFIFEKNKLKNIEGFPEKNLKTYFSVWKKCLRTS